jgi:hypothetical protein
MHKQVAQKILRKVEKAGAALRDAKILADLYGKTQLLSIHLEEAQGAHTLCHLAVKKAVKKPEAI